jgi:hypothetical protein
VVVKDFGRKEVDFTREKQAHNQGAHPEVVPMFSPASHCGFALFLIWTQSACLTLSIVHNTK